MIDEQRNVARPLAQRRQPDGDDVDAEVEVLAEAPRLDLVLELAVGRRDHAHVDLDRLGAADAADLALLQDAQQLRLHLAGDVADLVEEDGAALRLFEDAALATPPRR